MNATLRTSPVLPSATGIRISVPNDASPESMIQHTIVVSHDRLLIEDTCCGEVVGLHRSNSMDIATALHKLSGMSYTRVQTLIKEMQLLARGIANQDRV